MAVSKKEAHKTNLKFVSFCLFLLGGCLLFKEGNSRAIYETGSVTETELTHFEFLSRLGNPCGIERVENLPEADGPGATVDIEDPVNHTSFYESMILIADQGLIMLDSLISADPSLPTCQGIKLKTLPSTPTFSTSNEEFLYRDLYSSGIFLAAHFYIMGLDRQLSVVGLNNVRDEELNEHPEALPLWRMLRCGNESRNFMPRLEEITLHIEALLCTVVSSANLEQRATFREPFNRLTNTTFFRYHSSCSTLQTRDCLVLQEAKATLKAISTTFNTLLRESTYGGNGRDHYEIHTNDISF